MQIKVKNTRMHKVSGKPNPSGYTYHGGFEADTRLHEVPVAEGKLVLVECKPEEALLFQYLNTTTFVGIKMGHYVKGLGKYYKPILISETEKIEVGDWAYNLKTKELKQATTQDGAILSGMTWCKVLALPEHFSPKHLQAIVDGKLKDGDKVLVECEKKDYRGDWDYVGNNNSVYKTEHFIKFNSSNHITLRKTEEKMYTREESINHLAVYIRETSENDLSLKDAKDIAKEWFEQNVK